MKQKVSEHLENLMLCEKAIRLQFEMSSLESVNLSGGKSDPLRESEHEAVPGLINKYGNRVLCLLTAECASYCRFCTRRRLVSNASNGNASEAQIDKWVEYIAGHSEIREVIISGGDPFIVGDSIFQYAVESIYKIDTVKILRIGTRAPVSDPSLVTQNKLDVISRLSKPLYIGIHFEHPAEITEPTIDCVKKLLSAGAILYSQTVFLKGVNDNYRVLYDLFNGLLEIGVRPYYIYRCDPVEGAMHFRVDLEKERHIMTELRRNLSGLACPTYVIDAPDGSGKIPVPLEFWDADISHFVDFEGKLHKTE